MTDYKSPSDGTEDVLAFKERAGKPGGGKGILIGRNRTFTISTEQRDSICYAVENHPQDSRVEVKENVCQTLNAKMGTGGGNVPLVLFTSTRHAEYKEDLPTLRASGGDVGGD